MFTMSTTMNISLPDALKSYVDEHVAEAGYASSSEYVRELIRMDQARSQLRAAVMAGIQSGPGEPVNEAFYEALNQHAVTVAMQVADRAD